MLGEYQPNLLVGNKGEEYQPNFQAGREHSTGVSLFHVCSKQIIHLYMDRWSVESIPFEPYKSVICPFEAEK